MVSDFVAFVYQSAKYYTGMAFGGKACEDISVFVSALTERIFRPSFPELFFLGGLIVKFHTAEIFYK